MVSLLHAARDIGRVREISTVMVRYGFGEFVARLGLRRKPKSDAPEAPGSDEVAGQKAVEESTVATRVRRVLEELGPSFVKLGQLASTRPDLLPAEWITEFKKLQDSAPPVSFEDIRSQVETSLGAPLATLFEDFEEEPLAAASIAQVHRAKLHADDTAWEVVVKVQRPGIAETIASDVDLLYALASLIERAIPESRIYSPSGLVRQFDQAVSAELDFVTEGENARRFAKNFEGSERVRFPKVFADVSSKHVLTLEFLEGFKINEAVEQGYAPRQITRLAYATIVQQIFEDGFFHADPHPGNVRIFGEHADPSLALFDLGMVGRLSPRMRDLTVDVMMCALRHDYEGIADALYAMGTPTRSVDMNAFRAEVSVLSERYLGKALKDIEISALIRDLVRVGSVYGIEVPSEFLLVGKSLMTIEGIGKEIDPDFDIMEEGRPLFSELMKHRYSPERIGNEMLRRLERLSGATYNVPQRLEEVLGDLRAGRLRMRTENPQMTNAAEAVARHLFSGLTTASLVVGGAWLFAVDKRIPAYVLWALAILWVFGHLARSAYLEFWRRR